MKWNEFRKKVKKGDLFIWRHPNFPFEELCIVMRVDKKNVFPYYIENKHYKFGILGGSSFSEYIILDGSDDEKV